ncbi:MAG: DMT family transporter [Chloroflexi bacterium]|nr:DMT family transporter [Chloroflexota bacterium]
MWFFFALIAALSTSVLPIINKRLLQDTDVSIVAWGFNALSLPILAGATFFLAPMSQVDAPFWFGIAASGILNMFATFISTLALKLSDASLVTPFLTFNPIFTLLIAFIALGEVPTPVGAFGVAVIGMGAYFFALEEVKTNLLAPLCALAKQRGVVLAILASFIWGLTPIFEKIAIQHSAPQNPPLVAFLTTLVMTILLTPALWLRARDPFAQISRHARGFGIAALIAGIAPLFGFTAIAIGLVGYVTAIFKLSPVFTVGLARVFLDEKNLRARLLGSSVMTFGALLIAL